MQTSSNLTSKRATVPQPSVPSGDIDAKIESPCKTP